MNRKHFLVLGVLVLGMLACSKNVLETVFIGFIKPAHFPNTQYRFETNPVSKAGFELGRQLFYEPRLSRNNTISCGSCHIQTSAFTHHGHDVSHGIDDRLGKRNSPPIMNLAWHPAFMLDGGVFDLDLQPIVPITSHEEMDETIPNILSKLQALPVYTNQFKKVFGSDQITTSALMKALSQFMVMCVSSHSKYDSVIQKLGGVQFTADEFAGYQLVVQKCSPCHQEPLFSDFSYRNNGIGIGANNDMGRYEISLQDSDKYRFKVPSLRNLAFTAPYMHDGRFYTLDAVLDHYSRRIPSSPNLDPLLAENLGLSIHETERKQILAFLNTLNDPVFIRDRRFSEQ